MELHGATSIAAQLRSIATEAGHASDALAFDWLNPPTATDIRMIGSKFQRMERGINEAERSVASITDPAVRDTASVAVTGARDSIEAALGALRNGTIAPDPILRSDGVTVADSATGAARMHLRTAVDQLQMGAGRVEGPVDIAELAARFLRGEG